MRKLLLTLPLPILTLGACGNDITVSKGSSCNGQADGDETTVDAPFDADEDGAFDGSNPDCAATYAADRLDCDDQDPDVHPGAPEVACNLVDDDCDEATPDSDDADGDGSSSCEDCDDTNGSVSPLLTESTCNDLDDDCDPATLDAPDGDSDGITVCTDCNDGNPDINPTMFEATCNGLDDDCDDATSDAPDADGDGVLLCDDCNDASAEQSPMLSEVCGDGLDNNCDGAADEECVVDYNGSWTLDSRIQYTCARSYVDIDFTVFDIFQSEFSFELTSRGSGQPGTMTGTFATDTAFRVSRTIRGGCQEDYTVDGEFIDADTLEGRFTAAYTSTSGSCADCTTQYWEFTATRD